MQALKAHGSDVGIAFSGAEDVALVEYAHLTGRPYRVFRYVYISKRFLCSFSTLQVTSISAVTAYVQHVALAEMLRRIAIFCFVIGCIRGHR